ncbi:MAG: multidrug efflux SMR transporter [Pseudomonadota bacterium]
MPVAYLYLIASVAAEAVGYAALNTDAPFRRLIPSLAVAGGFGLSFWFLTLTLKHIPLGITYALASGLGIVATVAVGLAVFGERPDLPALAGLALIIAGIAVINTMSSIALH